MADEGKVTGQVWRWTVLASMASYIDAGSIVAGASGLALWQSALHMNSAVVGLLAAFSSNAISTAVGALIGGRLGDLWGRKRIYQFDLLVYAGQGYADVRVHPRPAGGITWARTHHEAPAGRVAVECEVGPPGLRLAVEVPPNAGAMVVLDAPSERVREGGRPLAEAPGVESVEGGPGHTAVRVGSGDYRFEVDDHGLQ
jgi:hypothetical protein